MMMKGALFDLDGVLADTASLHFKAWRKLAKENFDAVCPMSWRIRPGA